MEDIKLKIKLSAYTKGVIPDVSNYLEDVEDDGKIYVRTHKEWLDIKDVITDQLISVEDGSGLDLISDEESSTNKLSIRQQIITENDLTEDLDDDKTYYVIENKRPEFYVNGGTSFSDIEDEYRVKLVGGNAFTREFDLALKPINAKGVR